MFVVMFQGEAFSAVVRRLSGFERTPDRSGRPRPARLALGFLFCLAGVALIALSTQRGQAVHSDARAIIGVLSALFAAFAWGAYSNLGRFVAFRPGREPAGSSDLTSFGAMSFGVAMLGAVLAAQGQLHLPLGYVTELHLLHAAHAAVPVGALLVMTGVVVYSGGFTLWLYALDLGARLGEAHKLPPLTYLTPVLGVALGWVVLLEAAGPGFWPGAALIALGNAVIVLHRGPPAR
jgi:drug/metabolite transporter (DMT)-like permease